MRLRVPPGTHEPGIEHWDHYQGLGLIEHVPGVMRTAQARPFGHL